MLQMSHQLALDSFGDSAYTGSKAVVLGNSPPNFRNAGLF
jgi:hypothetical protein